MTLLSILVSMALAATAVTPQDQFSGVYVSEDGKYSVVLNKVEASIGDLFTPPTYIYEAKVVSEDQENLPFDLEVTLEKNAAVYAFSSDIECDDPGCDYYQEFDLNLVASEVPSLKLFYSGFTYEDSDREERHWDYETTLTRAYVGEIKFLEKEEIVYATSVQKLALETMAAKLKAQNLVMVEPEMPILSTVYKKVMDGRRVTALYVTTKTLSLPAVGTSRQGPTKTQCDMVLAKNESAKWEVKFSDCYLGGRNVEFRP